MDMDAPSITVHVGDVVQSLMGNMLPNAPMDVVSSVFQTYKDVNWQNCIFPGDSQSLVFPQFTGPTLTSYCFGSPCSGAGFSTPGIYLFYETGRSNNKFLQQPCESGVKVNITVIPVSYNGTTPTRTGYRYNNKNSWTNTCFGTGGCIAQSLDTGISSLQSYQEYFLWAGDDVTLPPTANYQRTDTVGVSSSDCSDYTLITWGYESFGDVNNFDVFQTANRTVNYAAVVPLSSNSASGFSDTCSCTSQGVTLTFASGVPTFIPPQCMSYCDATSIIPQPGETWYQNILTDHATTLTLGQESQSYDYTKYNFGLGDYINMTALQNCPGFGSSAPGRTVGLTAWIVVILVALCRL